MRDRPLEAERRREGFRAEAGIRLCDGEIWYFPKPRMAGAYIARGEDEAPVTVGITEFGPEYDFRAEEAIINNLNNRLSNAEVDWFARYLLRVNYELEDRDFYHLLQFRKDDPDNVRMWVDILGVALGLVFMRVDDPKASMPAEMTSSAGPPTASGSTASTPAA